MNPAHTHNLGFALLFIIAALLLVYGVCLMLNRPTQVSRTVVVGIAIMRMKQFVFDPCEDNYHEAMDYINANGIMMKEIPPELFEKFIKAAQGEMPK